MPYTVTGCAEVAYGLSKAAWRLRSSPVIGAVLTAVGSSHRAAITPRTA